MTEITLRPYQQAVNSALREKYRQGYRSVLLVAPTGSGKTVTFSYIAAAAAEKGNRTLILVHRRELVRQTSNTLTAFSVEHGIIAAGVTPDFNQKVQVASVQTLAARIRSGKSQFLRWKPTLVIVDEAHHATATTLWGKVMEHYQKATTPGALALGVTATPERLDGQGLGIGVGGLFDTMVMGPTIKELIHLSFLAKPVLYAPPMVADISSLKTVAGDYSKAYAEEAMDKATITVDAVEHYSRLCPHHPPAIAFCTTVAHAEHVADHFRAAGFRSIAIHGKMKQDVRSRCISGLADGTYHVLTSCEIVSEGTDIPVVEVAILLRPTQSLSMYLQQVGRPLRPYPGKPHATILDHVGNWTRHGLPDEEREWDLNSARRKKKKKKDEEKDIETMQCTKCFAVHVPAPACPVCGFVYPPPKERKIEVVDGQLEEVTEDRINALRAGGQKAARTYEELKSYGRMKGYKPGWARFVWEARQKNSRQRYS